MIQCSFRDLLSSCPEGKEYRKYLIIDRNRRAVMKKSGSVRVEKRSERSQK